MTVQNLQKELSTLLPVNSSYSQAVQGDQSVAIQNADFHLVLLFFYIVSSIPPFTLAPAVNFFHYIKLLLHIDIEERKNKEF